jgi:formate dehydrogenase major subunit
VELGLSRAPRDRHWLNASIPCQSACPAGTDIPAYLAAIYQGDYDLAYEINLRDNVFPSVLGRVCARPCQPACRHGWPGNGEAVEICSSKRAAADLGARKDPMLLQPLFGPTGKRVTVIGAGVAGLAAARDLARYGHSVTVYEKHDRPGGMLVQEIPAFRLPREAIAREIEQVLALGIELHCGVTVGKDVSLDSLLEDADALILASGTCRPNIPALPGNEYEGIEHGLDFLFEVNERGRSAVGDTVIVIGGGYTSMDCARTAIRLGARVVTVYYRRREEELVILPDELRQLQQETGRMEFCCEPIGYLGSGGRVTGVRFVRTTAGDVDGSGRRKATPVPGSGFSLEADHVILATGQYPDKRILDPHKAPDDSPSPQPPATRRGRSTGSTRLFTAGDFSTGATSLIQAIGHARACAREVDTFLQGRCRTVDVVRIEAASSTGRTPDMNLPPANSMPTLPAAERTLTAEVETGFDTASAKAEAARCYLCHYKFEIDDRKCVLCDACVLVKPVAGCIVAIDHVEYGTDGEITGYKKIASGTTRPLYYSRLYIDQTQCVRCGACERACPTDAISIQKVSRATIKAECRAND